MMPKPNAIVARNALAAMPLEKPARLIAWPVGWWNRP
jgi:hypothetical protein